MSLYKKLYPYQQNIIENNQKDVVESRIRRWPYEK